jgi:predicted transcriptional regulator
MPPGPDPVADDVTICLDPDLSRRLRSLARRTGRSPAEVIRTALADHLALHDDLRLPTWIGAWTSDAAAELRDR